MQGCWLPEACLPLEETSQSQYAAQGPRHPRWDRQRALPCRFHPADEATGLRHPVKAVADTAAPTPRVEMTGHVTCGPFVVARSCQRSKHVTNCDNGRPCVIASPVAVWNLSLRAASASRFSSKCIQSRQKPNPEEQGTYLRAEIDAPGPPVLASPVTPRAPPHRRPRGCGCACSRYHCHCYFPARRAAVARGLPRPRQVRAGLRPAGAHRRHLVQTSRQARHTLASLL